MDTKFKRAVRSVGKLPLWVIVWVFGVLAPVNMAAFFYTGTQTGFYGSAAFLLVMATNMPMLFIMGGLSKAMAIPHLAAWFPLIAYILHRAFLGDGYVPGSAEALLAGALVAVNGISLGFDVFDTVEWRRGNRSVIGFPEANPIK